MKSLISSIVGVKLKSTNLKTIPKFQQGPNQLRAQYDEDKEGKTAQRLTNLSFVVSLYIHPPAS